MKKEEISYLAGIFDLRGYVRYDYGRYYSYAIFFNFTEKDKELWKGIKKILDKVVVCRIYRSKKRKKELQLYIGSKKQVLNFLKLILPFSQRKDEISLIIKILETRGYKGVLK